MLSDTDTPGQPSPRTLARLLNKARTVAPAFAVEIAEIFPDLAQFGVADGKLCVDNGEVIRSEGEDVVTKLGGTSWLISKLIEIFDDEQNRLQQYNIDLQKKLDRTILSRDDTFRRFRELSSALSHWSKASPPCQDEPSILNPASVRLYFPERDIHTKQGQYVNGMIRVEPPEEDYGVFGPYTRMEPGLYDIAFLFDPGSPCEGLIVIDTAMNAVQQSSGWTLDLAKALDDECKISIIVSIKEFVSRFEFRIYSSTARYTLRACMSRRISVAELPTLLRPVNGDIG